MATALSSYPSSSEINPLLRSTVAKLMTEVHLLSPETADYQVNRMTEAELLLRLQYCREYQALEAIHELAREAGDVGLTFWYQGKEVAIDSASLLQLKKFSEFKALVRERAA